MIVEAACRSVPGMVRSANEDACIAQDLAGAFLVGVADGMGGHQAGDVASQLALGVLVEAAESRSESCSWPNWLEEATAKANRRVYEAAAARPDRRGMGTTLTAGLLAEGMIYLVHIGDSRAYLLSDGVLRPLTHDDSMVGEMLRRGDLSPSEAQSHPRKHVLTRAVGTRRDVRLNVRQHQLRVGDRILLCSDGLHSMVPDDRLAQLLGDGPAGQVADSLVEDANGRGGPDNVTAVVAEVLSL